MTLAFDINSGSVLLIALLTIGIGLLVCFFGYRLFRLYLSVIGFVAGFVIGASLVADTEPALQLFAGLGVGLIVALVAYALFVIGFLLAGALLGASFGVAMITLFEMQSDAAMAVILVAALIGASVAVVLRDLIVMLSTAFTGGGQVIAGGLLLLFPSDVQQSAEGLVTFDVSSGVALVAIIAWVILSLAGFGAQNRSDRARR